jgi:hypothetical protein
MTSIHFRILVWNFLSLFQKHGKAQQFSYNFFMEFPPGCVCARKGLLSYSVYWLKRLALILKASSVIELLRYHIAEIPGENQCRSHSNFKLAHRKVRNLGKFRVYSIREGGGITASKIWLVICKGSILS